MKSEEPRNRKPMPGIPALQPDGRIPLRRMHTGTVATILAAHSELSRVQAYRHFRRRSLEPSPPTLPVTARLLFKPGNRHGGAACSKPVADQGHNTDDDDRRHKEKARRGRHDGCSPLKGRQKHLDRERSPVWRDQKYRHLDFVQHQEECQGTARQRGTEPPLER